MHASEDGIYHLQQRVWQVLSEHPEGLSEYELLQRLEPEPQGNGRDFSDHLALFQTHFLLFHVLYRLRDALHADGRHGLNIDCLNIRLTPYVPAEPGLPSVSDPLRAYYLELDNLYQTGKGDVEELLASFWRRYAARDERARALAVLDLTDPVDAATIKQRFRELVMRHHPDRGGDKDRLQSINAAMAILEKTG